MTQRLQFPLHMGFKLMAFAPQFRVEDARGNTVAYVKQKLFKLKEAVTVFADEKLDRPVYKIAADRVIDFSALYNFSDMQGTALGGVKRHGVRSLWRAGFDVMDQGQAAFHIKEKSVMVRFLDGLISQLPIVGLFSGLLFHPAYLVSRPDGTVVAELNKLSALFEGKFSLSLHLPVSEREEQQLLLALMMVVLLERTRG